MTPSSRVPLSIFSMPGCSQLSSEDLNEVSAALRHPSEISLQGKIRARLGQQVTDACLAWVWIVSAAANMSAFTSDHQYGCQTCEIFWPNLKGKLRWSTADSFSRKRSCFCWQYCNLNGNGTLINIDQAWATSNAKFDRMAELLLGWRSSWNLRRSFVEGSASRTEGRGSPTCPHCAQGSGNFEDWSHTLGEVKH